MRVTKASLLPLCLAMALLAPAALAQAPAAGGAAAERLSVGPGADLGALDGVPIARIEVALEGTIRGAVPTITSVKSGDPMSAETARRAMRELLKTGLFADIRAEARADGGDAVLVLRALPRRLIASIDLRGAELDRGDTLSAASLREGSELTTPLLDSAALRIKAFYHKHGFPDATVTVDATDTDDPLRIAVRIEIRAGAPRIVSRRLFVITEKDDRAVGALRGAYRVGRGDRVDEAALSEADRAMTASLKANGFYKATTRHSIHDDDAGTSLYVHLSPGPRLAVHFEGNFTFDTDQLTRAVGALDDARPAELGERLRAFYVKRGYLDALVVATLTANPTAGTDDLNFSIRAGGRVRVKKRSFPCLPTSWPSDGMRLDAERLSEEIDSYLEEDLPGAETFWPGDPATIDATFGPRQGAGARAKPERLSPATTFAPYTYDRALNHLRDLLSAEGYLNASVGPLSVVRSSCDPISQPGTCVRPPAPSIQVSCEVDHLGLPIAPPPLPDALRCQPDPKRGVECAPDVDLYIPIIAGPQTRLYDIAIEGNQRLSDKRVAEIADLELGVPLSANRIEAARTRIVDAYRDLGFAYAEVATSIEPSPDQTRARVRFTIGERDLVTISGFVVKGATRTDTRLIVGRLSLEKDGPYRASLVRRSEELIATLGTFSSVSIALEDPEVPQRKKRVIITVSEQLPQYLDPRVGFSTGEGLRVAFEYGHRNIGGQAISLTLRVQLSYLFDLFILDPEVQQNLGPLPISQRLERRNTATIHFPEIGLGPLVSLGIDGVDVRDNQRDFGLTRQAIVPTFTVRPSRIVRADLGASLELNDVQVFNADNVDGAIRKNPALARLLRVPDGRTVAVSQRLGGAYDKRDSPFAATRGLLLAGAVEHVDAYPSDPTGSASEYKSHFLRLTGKVSGYVRLAKNGTSLAMSLSGGAITHLVDGSKTYPDRLFFLGGVDSLRSFLSDSLVPQDLALRVEQKSLGIDDIGIRGGDVFINPRLELRLPLGDTFALGAFADAGNLWVDPAAFNPLELRYASGAGLRIGTPIGPLALDYGVNLDRRAWEDFGAFHFSIGLF